MVYLEGEIYIHKETIDFKIRKQIIRYNAQWLDSNPLLREILKVNPRQSALLSYI